jgi:uncharacterized protein YkwD
LVDKFSIPQGFSNAVGFFIIVFLVEIIFGIIIRKLSSHFSGSTLEEINKVFGIFPGILSGVIFISFILILVVTFPVSAPIKHTISSSKIGSLMLANAQRWEKYINSVFGGAINETINFLTIEPKNNEIVSLHFKIENVVIDTAAEQDMFRLINKERTSRGLGEVIFDIGLRDVGRAHCRDMLKRGFFSHYTPERISPFDRMDSAGIVYNYAGENIALSPNTNIAMQGLMNSPGHKANILSTSFGKVGVGVIDGGIYGEAFCQEFTD